jgi:hypothetical protein
MRFIVLAETITGTTVTKGFIGKYSSLFLSTDTGVWHRLAYRVVGERRVIVDCSRQLLTIQVQRRSKRRWVTDDHGGGVRYLAGVLRDDAGSYVCPSSDLAYIAQVRTWLPAHLQALLLPDCDDWQAIERGDL